MYKWKIVIVRKIMKRPIQLVYKLSTFIEKIIGRSNKSLKITIDNKN